MTIGECLKYGSNEIGQRDAMLLLCHISGKNSAYIMLHYDKPLQNEVEFRRCVSRCKQGEPLQYIIGKWDFMGHTFNVDSRALIPRPETELLVEEALNFLRSCNVAKPHVLDMCTGSGCIASVIARAGEYNVTAVDISQDALDLACENGKNLGINFVQSDLFEQINDRYDLIISNPPYITTNEMGALSPVVSNYEPHLALHGGQDGMDIYRRLIPNSVKFLRPGGALFLEIGPAAVRNIMVESGFANVSMKPDYAGLDRIVYGYSPKE